MASPSLLLCISTESDQTAPFQGNLPDSPKGAQYAFPLRFYGFPHSPIPPAKVFALTTRRFPNANANSRRRLRQRRDTSESGANAYRENPAPCDREDVSWQFSTENYFSRRIPNPIGFMHTACSGRLEESTESQGPHEMIDFRQKLPPGRRPHAQPGNERSKGSLYKEAPSSIGVLLSLSNFTTSPSSYWRYRSPSASLFEYER